LIKGLKNIILFLALLVLFSETFAQQRFQSSMYMFNNYLNNPAVAGFKPCFDMKMGYRQQWAGFDGAPEAAYISASKQLKSKVKSAYIGKHAIGGIVYREEHGLYSNVNLAPSYSYHKKLTEKFTAAAGVSLGIQQNRYSLIRVSTAQANDPAVDNSSVNILIFPQVGAGLWLYNENFYFGLSVYQLFGGKMKNFEKEIGMDNRLKRHFYSTFGVRAYSYNSFSFIPSILIKSVNGAGFSGTANMMLDYADRFAIGVGMRNTNSAIAVVRLRILSTVEIGYSYDLTTSKLRSASASTHEIHLSIYTCPAKVYEKDGVIFCPAFH
jgi:type IX secretion system PorP/SprF family membrane protein